MTAYWYQSLAGPLPTDQSSKDSGNDTHYSDSQPVPQPKPVVDIGGAQQEGGATKDTANNKGRNSVSSQKGP